MPWLETSPMDQRKQFIADYQRGLQGVTELADRFEISRKTAYKWIDRYEQAARPRDGGCHLRHRDCTAVFEIGPGVPGPRNERSPSIKRGAG
jgi:transposase-like protein